MPLALGEACFQMLVGRRRSADGKKGRHRRAATAEEEGLDESLVAEAWLRTQEATIRLVTFTLVILALRCSVSPFSSIRWGMRGLT